MSIAPSVAPVAVMVELLLRKLFVIMVIFPPWPDAALALITLLSSTTNCGSMRMLPPLF
jgi:hypothetical protein